MKLFLLNHCIFVFILIFQKKKKKKRLLLEYCKVCDKNDKNVNEKTVLEEGI